MCAWLVRAWPAGRAAGGWRVPPALARTSQMYTWPSPPPVAKVPYLGWKVIAFTGCAVSTPPTMERWHLKAYLRVMKERGNGEWSW